MARTNTTRYVILGLLGLRPGSGYEIRKDVAEVTGYFWNESYGQIYPTLKRLAAEGLVSKRTERTGERPRHVYRISPRGRAALRRWLAEPVRPEPVRRELLLKLFFGRNVSPAVLMQHVLAHRERALALARGVAEIRAQLMREAGKSPDLRYWLTTVRFGERAGQAAVEWADETLREIRTWSGAPPISVTSRARSKARRAASPARSRT
jgi:DNA-binding PadR family transcriptional regulator